MILYYFRIVAKSRGVLKDEGWRRKAEGWINIFCPVDFVPFVFFVVQISPFSSTDSTDFHRYFNYFMCGSRVKKFCRTACSAPANFFLRVLRVLCGLFHPQIPQIPQILQIFITWRVFIRRRKWPAGSQCSCKCFSSCFLCFSWLKYPSFSSADFHRYFICFFYHENGFYTKKEMTGWKPVLLVWACCRISS